MSDSPYIDYWKNQVKLSTGISISGYSRAAENTGFYCPELGIAFDGGLPMNDKPSVICLTHLHNDHMCELHKMLIDNSKCPIIIIPNNDKFEKLLCTTLKYIYMASKFIHPDSPKGRDPKTTYSYKIFKLDVGSSYKFKETTQGDYYIEGIPSNHGVVSMSFGVYQNRKRCKLEYQNLSSDEYKKLKLDGIEFTEFYKFPIVCYMSDTSCKSLTSPLSNLIYSYSIVMIECTFLEDCDLPNAKKKSHIHWSQLVPVIKQNPSIKFILTHFSKKYTWIEIKSFFDLYQKTNEYIPNILLWLHTGPVDYGAGSVENDTNLVNCSTENKTDKKN